MSAPVTAKRKHQVGTPAPANKTRRLAHHKAFRTVPLAEAVAVRVHVAGYYAKRPQMVLPAAWRNKDRTHLATPALILVAGWVFFSPLLAIGCAILYTPIAVIGWDRHRPRSGHERTTRAEGKRLGNSIIHAPKVVDHRDCHAPAKPPRPRGDRVRIAGAEIVHPKLAGTLDKIKPVEDKPPLVSRYNRLKLPPFVDPDDYGRMTNTISNVYEQPVQFFRSNHTPSVATMRVQYIDWLSRVAAWERDDNVTPMRLPIGYDWDARTVYDSIHDQAWLVAGVRGAGKTAFIRGILARLWNLPNVELWLCDHADDLLDFHPYATRVARNPEDAVELSAKFVELHHKQRAEMVADRQKFVTWPAYPCRIFVVDELAGLTTHPEKDLKDEINRNLMIMATQGRKTAHSLLAATQQPNAAVIPTDVRGQLTRRLGLRVEEQTDPKMIMGSNDYDLRGIPEQHRGRGFWKGEGAAIPVRSFGLYDHDLSWLFTGDDDRDHPGKYWEPPTGPRQEHPVTPGYPLPPTPLFAVPDLEMTNEDRFRRALAGAPPTGLDLSTVNKLTDIPMSTLYRYVNLPGVEMVRSVKPRTYRLRERRSA